MNTNIHGFIHTINRTVTIRLLFPVLTLLFSFTPKGKEKLNAPVIRKEVIVESPFQSINISGDISVILTDKPAGTIVIEGNESEVEKIRWRNKNSELVIDASRKRRFEQLTIYLSATMLKHLLINGDGNISSGSTIKTDDLHIWLNGDIKVDIHTTGKVSVDAYDGYDLIWKPSLKQIIK